MEAVIETVVALYREVHAALRDEVGRMDDHALHWIPCPGANCVAVLVVHLLGSEAEVLHVARGEASSRDRDAKLVDRRLGARELLGLIDEADAMLVAKAAEMTPSDLQSLRPRPNRQPRTGLHWLIQNYGHAHEHLAHAQVTRQLYEHTVAAAPPDSASVQAVVAAAEHLFRDLRSASRTDDLDRLQQHLFVIGAEIGETLDALDLERLHGPDLSGAGNEPD